MVHLSFNLFLFYCPAVVEVDILEKDVDYGAAR